MWRTLRTTPAKGFYFAHAVGTGKTLTLITAARLLGAKHPMVFTNVAGVGVWHRQIFQWWPKETRPLVGRGAVYVQDDPTLHILKYDSIAGGLGKYLRNRVLEAKPDLIICDEAHRIKGPASLRTRAIQELARKLEVPLLLASGTPTHSPLDWWSPMHLIAPHIPIYGGRFTQYKQQVAKLGGPNQNWIIGFDKEQVKRVEVSIEPYVHIVDASVLGLPEPVFTIVPVKLGAQEQRMYDQMAKQAFVELSLDVFSEASNVLAKHLRLQQITSGFLEGDNGTLYEFENSKLEALEDLLEERSEEKVIVATRFAPDLARIVQRLQQGKRPWMFIDGGSSDQARTRVEDDFKKSKKPVVLVMQERAGGEAMDFTSCHHLIGYSLEPSNIAFEQWIGRIFRNGQQALCEIALLAGEGTTDEALYQGLLEHRDSYGLAALIAAHLGINS